MNNKNILKDFVDLNNDALKTAIDNLEDKDVNSALEYILQINKISTPTITKIGYSRQGDFYIKCETGFTIIK